MVFSKCKKTCLLEDSAMFLHVLHDLVSLQFRKGLEISFFISRENCKKCGLLKKWNISTHVIKYIYFSHFPLFWQTSSRLCWSMHYARHTECLCLMWLSPEGLVLLNDRKQKRTSSQILPGNLKKSTVHMPLQAMNESRLSVSLTACIEEVDIFSTFFANSSVTNWNIKLGHSLMFIIVSTEHD